MTDPINTQNRLRNNVVTPDSKASGAARPASSGEASNAKPRDEASLLELSSASLLEEMSEQIRNLPEVNEARVEAVKQALSNGEYEPDAEVIARKYSEIEKLLP